MKYLVEPLNNRLVFKELQVKNKSGIIVVNDKLKQDHTMIGEVLEVSNDIIDIRVGDKILAHRFAGTRVTINGEQVIIIEYKNIFGLVEGD